MADKTIVEIVAEFEKEYGPIDTDDDEPEDFDEGQV